MTVAELQKKLDFLLSQDAGNIISFHTQRMEHLLGRTGKAFVLFGAGRLGQVTLNGLRAAGIEPLAFADNSARLWGKKLEGVKIFSPEEANKRFGRTAVFVITVYTNSPVRTQLRNLGVDFVSFAELAWIYPRELLPHYAADLPYSIFNHRNDVYEALSVWADELSQREYLAQIEWRTSLNQNVLPMFIAPQEMYFQGDLFSILSTDTLVDCGAFDGDTIRELARRKINYHRLIAIEPDPINYQKLEKYVSALSILWRDKISLHQNAVGPTRERIQFDATGTASTKMESGLNSVESIPLDELLQNEKPAFIKMDIEGAEYQALIGGRQAIEKNQPILAICLYHRQEDLWRIPTLIQSISDRYQLFLRRYSDECWEQVCYAVPKERVVA